MSAILSVRARPPLPCLLLCTLCLLLPAPGAGSAPDNHDVPDPNFCDLPCCAWSLPDPGPDDALEYFLMRTVNGCGRLGSLGAGTEGPRVDPEPTICP